MQLTPHFTLDELTRSEIAMRLGVDNTPQPAVVDTLRRAAEGMELVRALLDCPIVISSGYRSPRVNTLVGGSATSQHCKGEAVDFTAPAFGTPREICRVIVDSDLDFDQLIFEGKWVHVSFTDKPRGAVLTAHFPTREGEKLHYTPGIG